MTDPLIEVLADLRAEGDALDAFVTALSDEDWRRPTVAAGWVVATQIGHLAWTDEVAVTAATDEAGWQALIESAIADPENFVDRQALSAGAVPRSDLLETWRAGRAQLATALAERPAGAKLPWFGPPMSATSMATARLMETWAHALDVYETFGALPDPTDRIKNVAHLGVRTRDFAFVTNGLTPPAEEFRIELVAPSGALWSYGPEDAVQRISGPAYDFCLVATQRRHRDDTELVAVGADADRWLSIAQAFAGAPGTGREPHHG